TDSIRRTLERRDAVKADLAGFEDQTSSEHGRRTERAVRHGRIPELDLTAPRFVPFGIEVEEQIETAIELPLAAFEVDMNVEPAVRPGHVHAAAEERRVGQQLRNAGEGREILEKRRTRQKVAQRFDVRRKARLIGDLNLLPLVHGVEREPERFGVFK